MAELYWITTLGRISITITLVCVGLMFVLLVLGLASAIFYDDECFPFKTCEKWLYRCGGSLIFLLVVQCFIPSTEELYAIYGIGTVIDYAQDSEEVQKIPDNAVKAINSYLESLTDKE